MQRKEKEIRKIEPDLSLPGPSGYQTIEEDEKRQQIDDSISDSSSHEDEDFKCPCVDKHMKKKAKVEKCNTQIRLSLPSTARAADLTGSSNRAVAKIANAVLEDLKIISKDKMENIIDKNIRFEEKSSKTENPFKKQYRLRQLRDYILMVVKTRLYFRKKDDV